MQLERCNPEPREDIIYSDLLLLATGCPALEVSRRFPKPSALTSTKAIDRGANDQSPETTKEPSPRNTQTPSHKALNPCLRQELSIGKLEMGPGSSVLEAIPERCQVRGWDAS